MWEKTKCIEGKIGKSIRCLTNCNGHVLSPSSSLNLLLTKTAKTRREKRNCSPEMKRNREEEEKEERLFSAKVVEYLEPLMSRELLCKFPDNFAFDFDYSQSSIWSPLITRAYNPLDLDLITPKKLSNDFGFDVVELEKNSVENCAKKRKRKMVTSPPFGINLCSIMKKKKMMKIRASEFSPTPVKDSCLPISTKGWAKVLKTASKHFKKKKKKDTGMHIKLAT